MKWELRTASSRKPKRKADFNGLSWVPPKRKDPLADARERAEYLRRELADIGASTPEQLRTMSHGKLERMWQQARPDEKPRGKPHRWFNGTSWIYGRL